MVMLGPCSIRWGPKCWISNVSPCAHCVIFILYGKCLFPYFSDIVCPHENKNTFWMLRCVYSELPTYPFHFLLPFPLWRLLVGSEWSQFSTWMWDVIPGKTLCIGNILPRTCPLIILPWYLMGWMQSSFTQNAGENERKKKNQMTWICSVSKKLTLFTKTAIVEIQKEQRYYIMVLKCR